MAKDTRPYFVLTNEYPRHRKIRALTDKAFRLHVELIADCNDARSDGKFSKHELNSRGPKAGKELIDAGLVTALQDGTYELHDYLSHQHSKKQIEDYQANKSEAGARGAHVKHHVKKEVKEPGCSFCQEPPNG
ncbi:hypothetical protein [Pseudarthrobacter sp. MEB009]|uniref:hypothetical protein n=1 Tax=Pseudarthrobacter sp. MEB009 TaxID=3040326 RepID=UPI0025546E1A|nr:hypothetical protein [Pseudarthrobacter sp. MEB009]